MAALNRTDLENLQRREIHLSILSAVFVFILAGGVAVLMYPLVFVHPVEASKWTLRIAFVGFCVLSLLFVFYLLDRQRMVRRLKQQLLFEALLGGWIRRKFRPENLQSDDAPQLFVIGLVHLAHASLAEEFFHAIASPEFHTGCKSLPGPPGNHSCG